MLNKVFLNAISDLKEMSDNTLKFHVYSNDLSGIRLPFCIKVEVTIDKVLVEAWGQGDSKDEASFKAVMELVERVSLSFFSPVLFKKMGLFKKRKITTNEVARRFFQTSSGCAIHISPKKAEENALNEIIERHVVLKSFSCNIYPQKIDVDSYLVKEARKVGIIISFFMWHGPMGRLVVLARAKKENHYTYSLGCDCNKEKAIKKALHEISGRLSFFEFPKSLDRARCDEHFLYHWDGGDEFVNEFFNSGKSCISKCDTDVSKSAFKFSTSPLPSIFKKAGNSLYFSRCINEEFQYLFKGPWSLDNLNIECSENIEGYRGFHVIG